MIRDPTSTRILVTGASGVGKTVVARELSRVMNVPYIRLHNEIISRNLAVYNEKYDAYDIVDPDKASSVIRSVLSRLGSYVCESMALELIDSDLVDAVVILRLNPVVLLERLKERRWRCEKIRDNVLAEVLDYFTIKALECFPDSRIIEVNTTGRDIHDIVMTIISHLRDPAKRRVVGIVDWIELLESTRPDFILRVERCEF